MERELKEDYVFHRDFTKKYPIITHGEGIYLYDEDGKKYIDACSGAVAANLGHGVEEIADAMAFQAKKAAFVHTMRFETEVLHTLSEKIAKLAPPSMNKVYFTSGGSEANESAIKLARQHHKDAGRPEKHIVIGRWQSYHGNTMGSLSAGGDIKRRQVYTPNLLNYNHIHSPYCKRCPYQREKADCDSKQNWSCVKDFESLVLEVGPEQISAFIAEPIVGSQLGAVSPPEVYFKEIRRICDKYNILLIVDEVMTGFGRTGKDFGIQHFGIIPDIITFGKGVSAGYAPLAGMIVHDRIVEGLMKNSKGKFVHGYTYSGHPVSVAAGLSVLRIYEREDILSNVQESGQYLRAKLLELKSKCPIIFDVRGEGLLMGIELAVDGVIGTPFPANLLASERINSIAMDLGAVFYPGSGSIGGHSGDHLLITPPLTVTKSEIDEMLGLLERALQIFIEEIKEAETHEVTK
ncbi:MULTISPECIES: aspartate aminotransferase family protein [unclassified Bacillus (in: firmicutes)]|uniref:aminotransferase family protein n=1 Tax=unclassified Bacillus (in: firmicutes) TaxID=185979 RepID=UPI0008EAE6DF|nr:MULTISPECIES: aminotransferase class III-fold pyridoxal phosphate-dependent enzyme [unclassified Bacillus (in: firmicutes)]SFA69625.1 Adenosylmethionine-8-amino-7-oxononanoate aminotransferase [Bacillus sp. UNCCL13]SFQ58946.1 Adenosylmethionine-8-amino-7-oxononanoate aminotransferase [Bacillus sp. cl95]